MQTKLIKLEDVENYDPELLLPAAECLREGGLVGFPTETVYGIAANAEIPEALSRLLEVRQSPKEKYLTIHIHSRDELAKYINIPPSFKLRKLMEKFWPGPLTIVFPTPDGKGVGVRYPNNKIACDLIRLSGVKVVAPSANLSGRPPALSAEEVLANFEGKIDFVIDGGSVRHGISSTVIRAFKPRIEILREGAIPKALLEEFIRVTILFVCTGNTCRSPLAEAICRKLLSQKYGISESALHERGIFIHSAGTAAGEGIATAEELQRIALQEGFSLKEHRSKALTISMIEEADYIYTMSKSHLDTIFEWSPESADKLFLLDPQGEEIEDPLGGTEDVYKKCIQRIKSAIEARLREISID
jgi:protein-tyrosine phosphatase